MTDDPVKQAEAELADLEAKGAEVGEHIDDARRDWEAKKADPGVPGAAGDPGRAAQGARNAETAYPAKGSSDELGGDA